MNCECRNIIAVWVLLVLGVFPSAAYALSLGKRPVLETSIQNIETELMQGKTATVNLSVFNSGGRPMKWSFKVCPVWLIPSPRDGTIEKGQQQSVLLRVA